MSEGREWVTFDENGQPLTLTRDGVSMPADYSFATVNDFVHRADDPRFKDLPWHLG